MWLPATAMLPKHTRVAQLGDAEHVAAQECHAAREHDRRTQLGAFAITINKSQGKSIAPVGVDLCDSVFTQGQLYVAASGVTRLNNIRFCVPLSCKTCNEVYTGVLSHN